jgi:Uma2 family endonuclease
MSAATSLTPPGTMTVREFLDWCPEDGPRWQLVDGAPRAMAPAKRTHGAIQGELGRLLGNHLAERGGDCSVVVTPGIVPRVLSANNLRIPDLAVACGGYEEEESVLTDPVLVVEILSPSNHAETWTNVWAYTSIPSVVEILVLRTTEIAAQLLRRQPDGSWPAAPEALDADSVLRLESLGGLEAPLRALYRTTRLTRAG